MSSQPGYRPAAFAAVYATWHAAHHVGDMWVQTHDQACRKGAPGPDGARACAAHVATYPATAAAALAVTARVTGLRLHPAAVTAGLAVSAGTHYVADRRRPLERLAEAMEARTGKHTFWRLGAPRNVEVITHGFPADAGPEAGQVVVWGEDGEQTSHDNPTLGTGAYALDQAWHTGWVAVAALIASAGARTR